MIDRLSSRAQRGISCVALAFLASATLLAQDAPITADPSAWRTEIPDRSATVFVDGATVWTQGPAGVIEDGDLLIRDGEIAAVGRDLSAPGDAVVVDGAGRHVTPGLIDCHSHTAIVDGVNEASRISTAAVRIADVVDATDVNIYRQLAGGLTTANLLHGSANAIGGQNAVIKLRWGTTPEELIFDAAPEGIKFALGENPKQSNWNVDSPRYPQTRPGVEDIIRERFTAALNYRHERERYRTTGEAANRVPPRPDLELAALLEILDGERLVHSHSYRADEILMLMEIAEDHGFEIATFQHVLEGYKVADELAAHGAGASTFSDWWAYKYEVVDAIPYNGAIMDDRGVVVSFNSDSSELARRLNLEAAKAVRYGGLSEPEALDFVTINPAIQLGIDDRVGSLESGKDADFVVWNGHPLSTYTVAEQTWVDGRKYFDREEDRARREALKAEREALLTKLEQKAEEKREEEDEKESDEAEPDEPESPAPDEPEEPEEPVEPEQPAPDEQLEPDPEEQQAPPESEEEPEPSEGEDDEPEVTR